MKNHLRSLPTALALLIAPGFSGIEAGAAGFVAKWIGQDGHDFVGGNPGPSKNDYQDIHIAVKGLPSNREIGEVVIRGYGSGEWKSSSKDHSVVMVVRPPRSTSADLYIEPYQREVGRTFDIRIKLDDGQEAVVTINGGKADHNLRTPGAGIDVKWLGQDGHDRTGTGPSVGPDGFEDVHLGLSKLSDKLDIKGVEVTGPGGLTWHSGLNPKAVANAELIRSEKDKTKADLYFSPGRDLAGQPLKVTVTYGNDRGDVASVAASKCSPAKAMPKVPAPTLVKSTATARWLGQDGIETSPGDVHVLIEGLPSSRQIVAAALSDGVVATWVYRANDKVKFEAGWPLDRLNIRRSSPTKVDLAFPPIRDESRATMTLRLLDQSGREEVLRFPGGPCDPDLRSPNLPTGKIVAKPGDDLNDLASKYGMVTLSKGVYSLAKPLVLSRPVRMIGEPGSTIRFTQAGEQPPWTAAIKIHAGRTTLEGFAVRFEGAFRWDRDVSFGPAVIGTTDDRDGGVQDPKYGITLARLDLEGPSVSSGWEEATRLIRVVTASSGRIEKNTLKGGTVVVAGGPWTISENTYKGTLPNTYNNGVFSARYTHDITVVGNKAGDEGPSGKTWRFLVLVQRGTHDVIKDNVVGGRIGPREDDPRQHENSPEIMLTEAYRLHYEGKPSSISTDGRVVVIPPPPGGSASTGDAVAILSGPQAGQWRTIAQPLGEQAYLLDEPIAGETDAISIATGFVRETFEGNTVDCRGSGIAADLVLAGNHFGARVLKNRFIGGGLSIRLLATPTEAPVHWGWSHAPFLGGLFEGNILEDSLGGSLGVEHGGAIKSTKGRVYMSLVFKDNTFRWSNPSVGTAKPPKIEIGFAPSLDPHELVITESGTKIEGAAPRSAWVHAATINGKVVEESPLTGPGTVGSKAGKGLGSTRRE